MPRERAVSPFLGVVQVGGVERARLLVRLDVPSRMTFLDAPSGFGKTALLQHWVEIRRARGDHVCWVDASQASSSATEFMHALVSGADGLNAAPPVFDSASHAIILVIDQAHSILSTEIVATVADSLRRSPSLRIVMSGQISSGLRQELVALTPHPVIIQGSELALTREEVLTFADGWGYRLSREEADDLYRATGGWPALALYLLEAPRRDKTFDVAHAGVRLRQLRGPVLSERSVDELAQRLALFDEFCWADVVVSAAFQESSEEELLDVVPLFARLCSLGRVTHVASTSTRGLAGSVSWWRLCEVERVALCEDLFSTFPARARKLAAYLGAQLWARDPDGRVGEILRLARGGTDWEMLSRLWARHALLLAAETPDVLQAAYDGLPSEAYEEHPTLEIARLALDVLRHPGGQDSHGEFYRHLDVARLLQTDTSKLSTVEEVIAILTSAISALRSYGKCADALTVCARVDKELAQRRAAGHASPTLLSTSWWLFQWAQTLWYTGHEEAAESVSVRAFETGARSSSDIATSCAAAQLSLICVRKGMTPYDERGRNWAQEHQRRKGQDRLLAELADLPACIADSWRAIDSLDRNAAQRLVRHAWAVGANTEHWIVAAEIRNQFLLTFGKPSDAWGELLGLSAGHDSDTLLAQIIDRSRAETLLALGNLNRAKRVLDDAATQVLGSVAEIDAVDVPWLRVPRARLYLIVGDHRKAHALAEISLWQYDLTARDRIELLLIQAASALALHDATTAQDVFHQARRLMEIHDVLRPYRTIPDPTLRELWGSRALPQAVTRTRPIYPASAPFVELTSRERMVIHRLANHATAPDIAREFVVSPNTVRKQIASIYTKLNVHNRQAMIETGKQLGLLPDTGGLSR